MTYAIHDLANLFPEMEPEQFEALKQDIAAHGQREPITLYQNQVVDGRHRYRACVELGKEPITRNWDGESLVDLVVSANLRRRHLTASQLGMIAVELEPAIAHELKKNQREHGGTAPGRPKNTCANLGSSDSETRKPAPKAAEIAAEKVGASSGYVKDAKKIASESPELAAQVKSGAITIPEAKRQLSGEEPSKAHVSNNSGNPEWYTPTAYLEAARAVLGEIDLDPASSDVAQRLVRAKRFYTAENDGLTKTWKGRVWMNPPYNAGLVDDFISKICEHKESGSVTEAIVLVNNATDTKWFQKAAALAKAICFPAGRIKFLDSEGNPKGAPLQGQAVLYMGGNVSVFVAQFSAFGFCVERL